MTHAFVTLAWSLLPQQQQPDLAHGFGQKHAVRKPPAVLETSLATWPVPQSEWRQQRVSLSVMRPMLSSQEVRRIVALLPREFDLDQADVEMIPKRWVVVEREGFAVEGRQALADAMRPVIEDRVLPFVRHRLDCPDCLVCSSIVRRYSHSLGERHRDPPHTDGQAFATLVVALNAAEVDYKGGLYVITDPAKPITVAMRAGDAVLHGWDLQHGVHVHSGLRLSWILWVQDAAPCVKQEELHQRPYFERAALDGNVVAMHLLGTGPSGRTAAGRQWLQRAADAGFVKAAAQLGASLMTKDEARARRLLELAAKQGDTGAQANLGMALVRLGDLTGAEEWLRKAAKDDHPIAQNELGMALLTGSFGSSEPEVAAEFLEAAARQGHAPAQSNLAFCYAEGRGTRRSLHAALYWWSEAATQRLPQAIDNLEVFRSAHPEWATWPTYDGSLADE